MKKGAIELSVNMIVILVLAVAMLVMGIQFSTKFFSKAENMRLAINHQTDDRIKQLLDDGQLVANPLNRLTVRPGQEGMFALGITNQLSDGGTTNEFEVKIERANSYPSPPETNCDFNSITVVTEEGDFKNGVALTKMIKEIPKNGNTNILVGVDVDRNTPQCTYVFDVTVKYESESGSGTFDTQYGNNVYKLYLKVD